MSCPHYSSLCLSVVFSFCLGLSLTRRSSPALSLSLARARSLLLEGSSTFVPSRTPLASQPAGMVSCSHPLSSSLPISGSLSLSLSLSLTLPGLPAAGFARRAPLSRLCSAAPAPQAVQRCSVTRLRPPRPLRHLRILWQLPCSCYSDGRLWTCSPPHRSRELKLLTLYKCCSDREQDLCQFSRSSQFLHNTVHDHSS